ncbi:hypothetical protein IMG5_175700, partial [Ichthyophthirius multifiliis]
HQSPQSKQNINDQSVDLTEQEDQNDDDLQQKMIKILGITSFASSKGKDHQHSAKESVFLFRKEKRQYRRYMNRKGGFNRALDKMD